MLHHSFEMLLKSAILQRQGKIRKPRQKQTISYSDCVRKCLTDGKIKFLTDEQALALQVINGQRNAAQHYIVDISEHLLYFHAQAGVTLFRDVHDDIFESSLLLELPERVLPVSTTAPKDLSTLFETEVAEIQQLLVEGTRRKMDAIAKARSLSVLEGAVAGDDEQPGDSELRKICDRIAEGKAWQGYLSRSCIHQYRDRRRGVDSESAANKERRNPRESVTGGRKNRSCCWNTKSQ